MKYFLIFFILFIKADIVFGNRILLSNVEKIRFYNESLNTGSAYGNSTLDGSSIGFGYNMDMDNGLCVRAEGNYMTFDGVSLTSADNTIKLKNLDGVTGKISVGKSFIPGS